MDACAEFLDFSLYCLDIAEVVRFFALQSFKFGFGFLEFFPAAAGQGNTPCVRLAQGANDVDARRVAFVADARMHRFKGVGPR